MSKQTAEQEAERRFPFMNPQEGSDDYNSLMAIKRESFLEGVQYAGSKEWISVEERTPYVPKGKDNSKNVFAICNGQLKVMAYCYIDGVGPDDSGWAWCDCNEHIDGDPGFDDDYKVTHWQPLPEPPPSK